MKVEDLLRYLGELAAISAVLEDWLAYKSATSACLNIVDNGWIGKFPMMAFQEGTPISLSGASGPLLVWCHVGHGGCVWVAEWNSVLNAAVEEN